MSDIMGIVTPLAFIAWLVWLGWNSKKKQKRLEEQRERNTVALEQIAESLTAGKKEGILGEEKAG